MLQKSCCSISDFDNLKSWWEQPTSYSNLDNSSISHKIPPLSRRDVREAKLNDIALFTWEMLNLSTELKKRARLIMMANKPDQTCFYAAKRFIDFRFLMNNYKDYLKKAQTCWRFTNDLQTNILCDVCDNGAQKNFKLNVNSNDPSPPRIFINNTAKAAFENACIEMIRMNLDNIYPYLELIEPLVRCDINGKKSVRDRLRLRKSQKIYDSLDDGLTAEMLKESMTFGEELNLNTEGDARFVTFLFRNVKEFLEQKIEGIDVLEKERNLKKQLEKESSKDEASTEKLHQRRLKELSSDKVFNIKVAETFANNKLSNKQKANKTIEHVTSRILYMKNNKRSDYEINQMIGDIKKSYGTVSKSIKNMPLFNKPTSRESPFSSPRVNYESQRILEENNDFDLKNYNEKKMTDEKSSEYSPSRYLVPVTKNGKSYFEQAKAINVPRKLKGRKLSDLVLKGYSKRMLMNMDNFFDKDYNPGRFLAKEANSPRKLAKKASKAKKDMQIRLEIMENNLTDEFNGGDLKGFEKAYPKDGFVKKILDTLKCIDVKKTNRKSNADQIILVKDTENDCLDLDKDKYKKMVKHFEKKIKYPSPIDWEKKDFDIKEFLEDNVTGHLDEVSNNLDKEAKYNEKELDKDGKEKKKKKKNVVRRLNVQEAAPRELGEVQALEKPAEKPAVVSETIAADNETAVVDISQETNNKTTPLDNSNYYPFNNIKEQSEAQKIKLLEKTMSQKLQKLLNKGFDLKSSKYKLEKLRESVEFSINDLLPYNILNGIGKTGFKKIDFEENKILEQFKEHDLYKRLDQSIARHVDWNDESVGRKTSMSAAFKITFNVAFMVILGLYLTFN